jgi:hypothetical protein
MRRDELVDFIRQRGDGVLAAALTALALLGVALTEASEAQRVASAALAVALGVAAARRSRDPLPLLGLMFAISVATLAMPMFVEHTNSGVFLFLLLAVYSAAAHTSGRRTLVAAGMTVGIFLTDFAMNYTDTAADVIIFSRSSWGRRGPRVVRSDNGA